MMASRGLPVLYLRREKEGSLTLQGLKPGEVRELTEEEIEEISRTPGIEERGR